MSRLWSGANYIASKIKTSANLQSAIKNIGWLFLDNILRMGVGLLVGVWVARYLGPEKFGIMNYAVAYTALFTGIASLGLEQIITRNTLKFPADSNVILGTAFILRAIGGAAALTISTIIYYLMHPDDIQVLVLIAILASGMIFTSFDVIDSWNQSQVKSKHTVIAKNTAFIIMAAVKVILINTSAKLSAFVIANTAEAIIASIGLVAVYNMRSNNIKNWKYNLPTAINLMKDSWPLILSSLMVMIYMRIDQVMIGEMIGPHEVGIYSVAVRLSEIWYFIPVAIINTIYPSIIILRNTDKSGYYNRINLLYIIMTWTGIVVAIITTFASSEIISLLYGDKYNSASSIMSISVWTGIFASLGVARSRWLILENLQKYSTLFFAIGAIINIAMNLYLIPLHGAKGASIATLITQIIVVLLAPMLFKQTRISSLMLLKSFMPIRGGSRLLGKSREIIEVTSMSQLNDK